MNKREFLRKLEDKLSILDEQEVTDILNEYEDIIDEKVKNGKTVGEAVSEFGSIDELSMEILKAYKLNSKYIQEKEPKAKNFEEGIKKASKECANFVSGLFKSNNFSIEFIFEIVIKFLILLVILAVLRLPFELVSNIGEVIFDVAFDPLDAILGFLFDIGMVILYFIVGAFIFILMFKQYLNIDENETKIIAKNELKEKKEKVKKLKKEKEPKLKNEKIEEDVKVVNETKKSNGTFGKIFSGLYKLFMLFVFLIPLWSCMFGLSIALVLLTYYAIIGIKIWGLVLIFIGLLIGFGWFTSFFHSITFDTKRIPAFFIVLAIVITIFGGVVFVNEFMSFEYKGEYIKNYDDYSSYEERIKLDRTSNNIHAYGNKIEFEFDETLPDDEIIVRVYYPKNVLVIDDIYMYDNYYIVPNGDFSNGFEIFKDTYNKVIEDLKAGEVYSYTDRSLYEYEVIGNTNTINRIK